MYLIIDLDTGVASQADDVNLDHLSEAEAVFRVHKNNFQRFDYEEEEWVDVDN